MCKQHTSSTVKLVAVKLVELHKYANISNEKIYNSQISHDTYMSVT